MKLRRRIGSVFLAFAMALSLIPSVAVSALAATSSSNQGYFTFDYDNQGTKKRTVTVNLYDPDEQLLDTLTVTDVRSRNEDYTIALTNKAIDTYDIESVSVNGGNVTLPTRYKDSYEFRMDLELVSSSTINVYLCPEFKAPEIVGEVERGDLYYRITEASLLKLLHDNEVEVDAETTFPDQRGVKLHFVEEYLTFSEWSLDRALSAGNNLLYYQNGAALSNIEEEAGPGNIQYIEIPYQLSDGTKGSKKIYSGDLKYIKVSDTTYEIESKKNQDEHIVIFYTEGNTPDTGVWYPLEVRFIQNGKTVGTAENDMPTADTYGGRTFVAWTQQHNGGLPVIYNTLVNDDMNVFPQYKLDGSDPQIIHVMNNDDLLQKRVAELLGCSVDAIDWGSMKITVHGQGNAATNPDYGAPGGIHNDWNDEEDRDFYKVYNYRTGAEGTAYENKPIPVDEITSISVSVCKVGETDYEKSVEIEKGAFAGDFAISMGNLSGDWLVELYINAEDTYPENPDTPEPGTDPAITDFSKDLVSSEQAATEAGITGTYTFPNEDGKVIIPYDESVTLLYAITVTGEGGTTFSVTDTGAQLVTVSGVSIDQSGNDFTGTISDTGSITFYVSKSFTAADITDNGKLTNTAKLTGDNAPEEGGEDTEEVDAKEETNTVYVYVQFVKEDGSTLSEEDKQLIESTYGTGLKEDGYMPIGYFDAAIPSVDGYNHGADQFSALLGSEFVLDNDDITAWATGVTQDNLNLAEDVTWTKLSVAHGALDFDEELTADCWHLDGQIQLYAPDISVDKELTKVVRNNAEQTVSDNMTLEVGDVLTWTITVTNSGNADAEGLTLTDTLVAVDEDGTTSNLDATVTPGEGVTLGQDGTFTVPAAGNGTPSEVEFTATYTVTDGDKGLTLKNTATVSDGDDDTEDPSGETENPVAERKVEITKELTKVGETEYDGTSMVNVGDELTYTITVKNTGNVDLTDVVVEDTLTVGDTTVTEGVNLSCTDTDVTINGTTATIGSLAVDEPVTITATYTVKEADAEKEIVNTATVSGDEIDDGDGDTEEVTVANPAVDMTKVLASATRDGTAISDLDTYKAQVGDVLSYTITVTNEGNTELTNVEVKDTMWGHNGDCVKVSGKADLQDVSSGSYTITSIPVADDANPGNNVVTITYTYTVQDSDVAAGEIKNTAGVYLPDGDEPGEEPDDTDEIIVNMDEDAYTITITPADIVIYTGGTGYAGVLANEDGELVSGTTESGLPEPGYHIDLPDAVETWLKEQGVDMSVAADLANYLHFRYYDANGEMTRNWDLEDQGVYSMEGDTVTAYVYSLSTNTVEGEFKDTPVRLEFTNNGEIVTDDIVKMDENTASATYQMTIYDGGLDQSQIKAVFTAKDSEGNEKSITCNVTIGTGYLTVKSVADENPDTNAIVDSGDKVTADTPTAVADDGVDFYVNDSQVTVDSSRVGLLVDSVSNSDEFNTDMEEDAISEVREDNTSLASDAQAQSYYLDLVDTDNGNAVVTMGDGDELTIYWPMPEDADPNGEFYIVHYDKMDRQNVTDLQSDPTTIEAKVDGNHLTFETSSFSPFVLVYEQKDSGTPTPPVTDPDDKPTPPVVDPDKPQLNTEDHYAYIVGYEDGTVRPEGDITRAEVATIFFRLLTDESRDEYWSQTNDYTDVAEGDWYNNAVSTLSKAGILNGYEDGSFQPNGNITRAEFATIAARFFEATYEGEDLFPDIEGHWARDYINQAAHAGIVNGYEDGTFQPQENITRAEAMTIVNRTLDRHPDADHFLDNMKTWPDNLESAWYYEQVQEATNSHEYIMKTDADKNPYEIWKEILPVRDWSDLENTWSEAHAG